MYKRKSDERLLEELLDKGYGVDERKKWRERWRKNLEANTALERRRRAGTKERSGEIKNSRKPIRILFDKASEICAREEPDPVISITQQLRRRIDSYAFQNKYRITGLREKIRSVLTLFFPNLKDYASKALVELLVDGNGYRIENPMAYSFSDNLDALFFSSCYLLGRYRTGKNTLPKNNAASGGLEEEIRRREPFAVDLFSLFASQDDALLRSLDYIKIRHRRSKKIEIQDLVFIVKALYRFVLILVNIDLNKLNRMFAEVADANSMYHENREEQIDICINRFRIACSNLAEFKHQLFPVLLKMIGVFFMEEEMNISTNRRKIEAFLGITPDDRLSVKRINYDKARRKRNRIKAAEGQPKEGEHGREKEKGGPQSELMEGFEKVLPQLESLFPGSGIEKLVEWPEILPYFDLKVFNKDLTFPSQIQNLSRFDPMGQIMVLHRIIDNMLTSIDAYALDESLEMDGKLKERLSYICSEWRVIYSNLFDVYLKELCDYIRMMAPDSEGRLRQTSVSHRIGENLNQIRSLAFRHYEVVLIGVSKQFRFSSVFLYKLAEELYDFLQEIGDTFNGAAVAAGSGPALRLLDEFTYRSVFNLEANEHKPTIRGIVGYIAEKYKNEYTTLPAESQLCFFEILRGVAGLYRYLLNEKASFYREAEGRIFYSRDEERTAWENARQSLVEAITTDTDQNAEIR